MQSSTILSKRLPARWLDMFCDSSVSTAPWPLSFAVAAASWSILASVSSLAQAICLQVSRSAWACSGVVPGLVQEWVLENHEQPASNATIVMGNRIRINASIENSALPCRDRNEVATYGILRSAGGQDAEVVLIFRPRLARRMVGG